MLKGVEKRHAFLLLAGSLLFVQLSYFLTVSALPLYLHQVGTPVARVGLDVGIGSVVALVLTLIVGPLLNRRGPRLFLALGSAAFIAAAVLMLAFGHEGPTVVGRLLQGAGSALVVPNAYAAVPLMAPKRVGSAIGITGTIGNVPLAIGPALGLARYRRGGPGYLFWPAIGLGLLGLAFSVALRLPRPANVGQQTLSLGFDLRWTGPLIANGLQGV
jgi:MFS family permease